MKFKKSMAVAISVMMMNMGMAAYAAPSVDLSTLLGMLKDYPAYQQTALEIFSKNAGAVGEKVDYKSMEAELKEAVNAAIEKDPTLAEKLESKGLTVNKLVKDQMSVVKSMDKEDLDLIKEVAELAKEGGANFEDLIDDVIKVTDEYIKEDKPSSGGGGGSSSGKGNSSSTVVVTPPTTIDSFTKFEDTKGHWAQAAVGKLAAKGIIKGKNSYMFDPDGSVTRAEFAAIVVRAFDLEAKAGMKPSFDDVNSSDWFYDEVVAAWSNGIIEGYSDDEFAPSDKITREQMVKMVVGALEAKGLLKDGQDADGILAAYADKSDISGWAMKSMKSAVSMGLINGKSNNKMEPKSGATRAEAATMIGRVLDK